MLCKIPGYLIISIFLICVLTACGQKDKATIDPRLDAPTIYKNFCLSCHGANLEGFRGPNIQQVGARLSEEELILLIQKGKEGMPGFKMSLKEADIQKLAKWLSEKNR